MEVRQIRADEGMALKGVRLRALRLAPEAYHTTLDEASEHPDEVWHDRATRAADGAYEAMFVVDRGQGVLGGMVYVNALPEPPHDAFISSMWLDDDLRGGGMADALMQSAESWARALGAPQVELWASYANDRARRFYARHGYVLGGVEEAWDRGGGSSLFVKDLASEIRAGD
ncbi:MAG: GNAT family N-acetyltransferase [Chloroflexi bacterium]|nr:GNAT family N-acetyltransferase [Chloroflexota bacterium]MDA1239296.1 GNAT family N-acetyltransferase [Chloroflexota bacterium]